VSGRVGDCCCRADIDTSKHESLEAQLHDHCIEILDSRVQGQIGDGSVRESHAAYVISDNLPTKRRQPICYATDVMPWELAI
jgi:hypothetical protein